MTTYGHRDAALQKIAKALPVAFGKTIVRAFIAEYRDARFSLYLVFSDDTHYEFYGHNLEGAREVELGGIEVVRAFLHEGRDPTRLVEISPPQT